MLGPPAANEIWVPEHYDLETAATIRRLELAGHISAERASVAISRSLSTPTRRVQIRPLLSEAWPLRHNLTIGDALYVVVARHLRAPLLTLDANLANAPRLNIVPVLP